MAFFLVCAGGCGPCFGGFLWVLITWAGSGEGRGGKVGRMGQFLGRAAPLDAQAQALDTIPYEILTRLGDRFERSYLEG